MKNIFYWGSWLSFCWQQDFDSSRSSVNTRE